MDLVLVAPEDEWDKDLLYRYYEYKREKERKIHPDKDWSDVEETVGYQVAVKELNQTLLILEQIPRSLREAIDTQKFRCMLGGVEDRKKLYGEDIEDLIRLLKNSKQELVEKGKEEDQAEMIVEAGPVAVCEFAIKNDYGVRLSE